MHNKLLKGREGKTHASVSRFLTRIVFGLNRGKSNCFTSRPNFGPLMEYACFVRVQMRKKISMENVLLR